MPSIIIPACNEEAWIGACLSALLAQEGDNLMEVEIVVAANGCQDATVVIARGFKSEIEARGWRYKVLDIRQGSKTNALNEADRIATRGMRVYLDADIVCDPKMMSLLVAALDRPKPTYATGRLVVAPAKSWVTQCYADLFQRLPFTTKEGNGAGLFAVNAAGRARWSTFPEIIADDGYVRLHFAPNERIGVAANYLWPSVEGFRALVRVRRRQDAGTHELGEKFPILMQNESKWPVDHLRLFLQTPLSYLVYVAVMVAVRIGGHGRQAWTRGR